jgi:hypothetical protein
MLLRKRTRRRRSSFQSTICFGVDGEKGDLYATTRNNVEEE